MRDETPTINIDYDCGEAYINWRKFDTLSSLMRADILKDLLGEVQEAYEKVVNDDQFLADLVPGKVRCIKCDRLADDKTAHLHKGRWIGECCWDERLRTTE